MSSLFEPADPEPVECVQSAGPQRSPGERRQDRSNPNPDKQKKRDNQDGKKLPPKPPERPVFTPPPAIKQPNTK
jgi:hypothetical protein